MAPKNKETLEANPHSQSSEEQSSSETTTPPPPPPTNPKPSSSAQSDSDTAESDSGSAESDSQSDAETNTRAVAPPPVSKPAAATPVKSSNPKPQSSSSSSAGSTSQTNNRAVIAPPVLKSTATPAKRPAEPQPEKKESKRAKKGEGESEKSSRPRVWSSEDEIALINGMIDFEKKNDVSVQANKNAFYSFIKGSLQNDVSKIQVSEKIRHLKIKYLKQRKTGSVLKPHEKPLFDLSHNVWGETNVIASEEPKRIGNQKGKKIKNEGSTTPHPHKPEQPEYLPPPPSSDFVQFIGSDNYDPIQDYVMKKGLGLIEASEREELQKSWEKLRKKELEVHVERCGLVYKEAKMVLEAHK